MKRFGLLLFLFSFLLTGRLFSGGNRQESAGGSASSSATAAGVKMINGWPEQWYEAPTASESGIKSFSEAPMLSDLVKAGKLPPVEQRIPAGDALVIQSLDGNGVYGGTLRGARLGPNDWGDGVRAITGYIFRNDPTITKIIPLFAKDYEISPSGDSITIYLRKGARWSDGQPFTSDDFMFIYEEMWNNPDLSSFFGFPASFVFNGKKSVYKKIDEYTVQVVFPTTLPDIKIIGMFNSDSNRGYFAPAHFAKQFMPKYNPKAEEIAKADGAASWQQYMSIRLNLNPGRTYPMPEIGPWILTEATDRGVSYERNPYYPVVDEKGRQLPYIDKFVTTYYTDSQVAILSAMQGNVDLIGRMLAPADLPVYKENEAKGNYTTYVWMSTKMAALTFHPNLAYTEDKVLGQILKDTRFRQALSLALNRDEINQLVFLGLGKPQQFTIGQGASFYKQGWDQLYAKYDPAAAKKLLADMGLRTSNTGAVLRPDGKALELDLILSNESLVGIIGQKITELAAQYWGEIGIKCGVRVVDQGYFESLATQGIQVYIFPSESDLEIRATNIIWDFSFDRTTLGYAPEWYRYFAHEDWLKDGKTGPEPVTGEEPPADIKQMRADYLRYFGASNEKEYQEYASKTWGNIMNNLFHIGTVGNVPSPVIVTNRIKNVTPEIPFSFESFLWQTATLPQWYFANTK